MVFERVVKNKSNALIVGPDVGATLRAKALANALGTDFIVAKKKRMKSGEKSK